MWPECPLIQAKYSRGETIKWPVLVIRAQPNSGHLFVNNRRVHSFLLNLQLYTMLRLGTPETEGRRPFQHYHTPHRKELRTAIQFNLAAGKPFKRTEIYAAKLFSERSARRALAPGSSRRLHNNPKSKETRGRHHAIPPEKIREMDTFIQTEGFEARKLTWLQVAAEVGIEGVTERTIRNTMGNFMGYSKCLACQRGYVGPDLAKRRVEWAKEMLKRYPNPEDWRRVRFSDEVHFSYGPEGKARIIRKPGERYCSDCIQEVNEPKDKNKYRIHAWAAFGWNFKSEIVFYKTKSANGKMTQDDYINQILEPHVLPWIKAKHNFILEEDGDSSHGPKNNNNKVRQWKKAHGLEGYFNTPQSPDLAPIENGWQPTKAHVKSHAHWDKETLGNLILEGWDGISQDWINRRIDSMPARLKEVIDREGKLSTVETINKKPLP